MTGAAPGGIKAIETRYAGCRFRSRLEARWAVFFDAMGWSWEYEPEGYDLGELGWYLPDFRVKFDSAGLSWVEIKGVPPTAHEKALVTELSWCTRMPAMILFGDIACRAWMPNGAPSCAYGVTGYVAHNGRFPGSLDSESHWHFEKFEEDFHRGQLIHDRVLIPGEGVPAAVERARSARFEHGESG
jgi:hypothetical protein